MALSRKNLAMRVTLAEVAGQAGVSIGTASMALAGNPRIFPETLERVRQAAKALGPV